MSEEKKGYLKRLIDKLDRKLEKKSKEKKCACCCKDSSENDESCCNQ